MISLLTGYHIAILIVFKYLDFIVTDILNPIGFSLIAPSIQLPIGISFFTFQLMSYLFDVYYMKADSQKCFYKLILYISFFPQLIVGSIVRYKTIVGQIENRDDKLPAISIGLKRFIIGLGKKVLIADILGEAADHIFLCAEISYIGLVSARVGCICYTLQIYYDFSGYSDMAIGLGKCFGFDFEENFDYPYIAKSITDFWRKWHISLTNWFRDYVYIPLGGNRVSKRRHIINIFIVWLFTGIWHGANWTSLIWGMVYCALQILEKKKIITPNKWPTIFAHFYTLCIVNMLWVVFKANNLNSAISFIQSMFGRNGIFDVNSVFYVRSTSIVIMIACIGSTPIPKKFITGLKEKCKHQFIGQIVGGLGLLLVLLTVVSISIGR